MAEEDYITLRQEGRAECEEKRSRFIGCACPAETEGEALGFLARIRGEFPDATHHVYAYVLRENATTRYSDDREPQGTAGLPVLDVLRHGAICNACVVVVRYFGGTLLGTGGLVRAYTHAAQIAVEQAGIVKRMRLSNYVLSCSYPDYQKVQFYLAGQPVLIRDSDFSDQVTLHVSTPAQEGERLVRELCDLCHARVAIRQEADTYGDM